MRTFFDCLVVGLLLTVSCQNSNQMDVDCPDFPCNRIESVISRINASKISSESDTISPEDAQKVALLQMRSDNRTKSCSGIIIKSIVPVFYDKEDLVMFAVNFDDGYILVSASKRFYPIIARVEKGTYSGENTNTGFDDYFNELKERIAKSESDTAYSVASRDVWMPYEQQVFDLPARTISVDFNEVMESYIETWAEEGRSVYRLRNKPENMSDSDYEEFYSIAESDAGIDDPDELGDLVLITEKYYPNNTDIGPLLSTQWGQNYPYNSSLPDQSAKLGCVTIAVAQIMKYHEYPAFLNWDAMPNNTSSAVLSSFLASLYEDLDVTDSGSSTITDAKNVLTSYGYSCQQYNYTGARTEGSLRNGNPVYMRGGDVSSGIGHAWVCDGCDLQEPYTEYELFIPSYIDSNTGVYSSRSSIRYYGSQVKYYHMNWGWQGLNDGYFYSDNVVVGSMNFANNRKVLIISHN